MAAIFHAGEHQVQQRMGVRERMERLGARVIRDHLPEQHRAFYAQLPFLTVGHVDAEGRPWASVLAGAPGFLSTPDARTLRVAALPVPGDPLEQVRGSTPIGVLGLEPSKRRRNRMSGVLTQRDSHGLTLAVRQSFGNCPQYIHPRTVQWVGDVGEERLLPASERMTQLDREARGLIAGSDTFFVASATATESVAPVSSNVSLGADVSHRGGQPGFVGIEENGTLVIPDFAGNNHFNTLGNFVVNPRAGLLFIDFESGDLLQLSGSVRIVWEGPEVNALAGAKRLWKFVPEKGVRLRSRLGLRF